MYSVHVHVHGTHTVGNKHKINIHVHVHALVSMTIYMYMYTCGSMNHIHTVHVHVLYMYITTPLQMSGGLGARLEHITYQAVSSLIGCCCLGGRGIADHTPSPGVEGVAGGSTCSGRVDCARE